MLFSSKFCINFDSVFFNIELVQIVKAKALNFCSHFVPHLIEFCIALSKNHTPRSITYRLVNTVALPSDSADISVIRNSVNKAVCDASWRMIFAKDDAEFDKMWSEMATEVKGFGFDDLYKFDVEKHTIEVNAKLAAK